MNPSLQRWYAIAACLIAALAAWPAGASDAAETVEGRLSVGDALTAPGRAVRLEARLVKTGFGAVGLGGEQIEFSVGPRAVGRAMTGGDGRAYLEYTPRTHGAERVTVRLADARRVYSAPADGMLFVWERRRPLLFVELAAVLEPDPVSALPRLPGGLGGLPKREPVAGAAEELGRLARFYINPVYVVREAAEALEQPAETRAWLVERHFPPGYVLRVGPAVEALESRLDDLQREGWDHVRAGVGRTLDFADVLLRRRHDVILVPPPDRGDVPKKARTAKDWKEVRKKLQG